MAKHAKYTDPRHQRVEDYRRDAYGSGRHARGAGSPQASNRQASGHEGQPYPQASNWDRQRYGHAAGREYQQYGQPAGREYQQYGQPAGREAQRYGQTPSRGAVQRQQTTAWDPRTQTAPSTEQRWSREQAAGFDAFGHSAAVAKKHRRKRVGVGIAVAVLLVLGAALAAVFLYMGALDRALTLDDEDLSASDLLTVGIDKPFYMLILGSDTRNKAQLKASADEELNTSERSDVIVLARIDLASKQVSLLSIPRDTPWRDPSDGQYKKINEAYVNGGAAGIVSAVEQVSGVDISHYAKVRFADFQQLIDTMGGITINVPQTVTYWDALTYEKITVEKGKQHLDGQHALILARARHEYNDGQDAGRQRAVRLIIGAMADRVKELPINELPGVILSAAECVSTDLTSADVLAIGMAFHGGSKMYNASAPYKGNFNKALGGLWYCYEDREGWQKVMGIIDSGGDPSDVSYKGDTAYIAGTDETVIIE